jgi:hypothetical protein
MASEQDHGGDASQRGRLVSVSEMKHMYEERLRKKKAEQDRLSMMHPKQSPRASGNHEGVLLRNAECVGTWRY